MDLFDTAPFKETNDAFKRLLDVANLNAMTPRERAIYDENLKNYRDWRCTTEYAIEQANKKGWQEGQYQNSLRTATKMKQKGYDPEEIAECTGLSMEEIEKL